MKRTDSNDMSGYLEDRMLMVSLYRRLASRDIDAILYSYTRDGKQVAFLTRSTRRKGALQLSVLQGLKPFGHLTSACGSDFDLPYAGCIVYAICDSRRVDIEGLVGMMEPGEW